MVGTTEDQRTTLLRREIKKQYRTVREFSIDVEIPYATVEMILQSDVGQFPYDLVLAMVRKLGIDPYSFLPDDITINHEIGQNLVLREFVKLNNTGRRKILELMKDYSQLEKYQNIIEDVLEADPE